MSITTEAYTCNNPSPPPRPITPLDYIDEELEGQPMETEPTEPVDLVERGRDYLKFNFPNFQNRVRERRKKFFTKRRPEAIKRSIPDPIDGPPNVQRRRSERIIIPRSRPDNAYGDKPPVQIEREIKEKRDALEKELMQPEKDTNKIHTILHSLKTLKEILPYAKRSYLNKIIKEGGNEFVHYLLSNALQREDAQSWNYRDVEKFRRSSPSDWKLWRAAMEDEFKSLQDRNIWELVDLPKG